jgi:hypothetical protein
MTVFMRLDNPAGSPDNSAPAFHRPPLPTHEPDDD